MLLSFLPPLGHRYLGRWRRGVPVMMAMMLAITMLVVSAVLALGDPDRVDGYAVSSMLYGLWVLIFSWTWSALEVNDACNRLGLGHENGFFEMKVRDTASWMVALGLVVASSIFATSAFLWAEGYISAAGTASLTSVALAPVLLMIINVFGRRCLQESWA